LYQGDRSCISPAAFLAPREVRITHQGIGQIIREARRALGWSQKILADKLDFSQSLVSAWENSAAAPSAEQIRALARVLARDEHLLVEACELTEIRNAAKPRSIEAILNDAADFLTEHPSELWLLGPNHLPVLESGSARDAWLENLEQGFSYNLIWVLDCITPADLNTALPHFAKIAAEAAQHGAAADEPLGEIRCHAVNASNHEVEAAGTYERFRAALELDESGVGEYLKMLPYYPLADWRSTWPDETKALDEATKELVRVWQPETSIILYQPRSPVAPPVANMRLMPVSERIFTRDGIEQRPMYWLRPPGAARISHVVANVEEKLKLLRARVAQSQGEKGQ
jgi:transcriptional regulator with XRE-family HTH domain